MIRLPIQLDRHLRDSIHRQYDTMVEEARGFSEGIPRAEFVILRGRLLRKAGVLSSRGVGWQDSLARYALALLPILEQPIGSLDPGVVACAFAAAQYLCQSEDAIPDHTLGTGYIDDAIVINRCLALFKRGDPKTFATVERLATSK